MTKETFQQAADANKRIEFFSHMQKVLNGSGIESFIHPEIIKGFGKDYFGLIKEDLLPSVTARLEKAKQDLENL
jgi:hypothetical protein